MGPDFMDNFSFDVSVFKSLGEDPWAFRGIASTTSIDRQGERMTEKAIADFKEQIKPSCKKSVPLCVGTDHKSVMANVTAEVGKIEQVGGDSNTFEIFGRIDEDHPFGKSLAKRLQDTEDPPDWKLSIGGSIPSGGKSMLWDSTLGQHVVEINKIDLNHVFLCRGEAAVNQDTAISGKSESDWAECVFKAASVDVSDKPWGDVDQTKLPSECYLYVGDPEKKSTWKFPVYEGAGGVGSDGMYTSRGPLNRAAMASAASYLNDENRKNKIPDDVASVVEPKLRSLYNRINQDFPSSHKAEDPLEAPTMPETVVDSVPVAQDAQMGFVEKILDALLVATGVGKSAPPPAEEPPVEVAPVEKAEEPDYVTKAELEEFRQSIAEMIGNLETTLTETVAKMSVTEKAADTPAEGEPVAEPTPETPPVEKAEEPTPEPEPEPATPPASAQLPLETAAKATTRTPQDGPDILGAFESNPDAIQALVRTFTRTD